LRGVSKLSTTGALYLVALVACAGDGGSWATRTAPWTYRIGCEGGMQFCFNRAARVCPAGFHVNGEGQHVTGAQANTSVVGKTAITSVRTEREGALMVACIVPTYCKQQTDCPTGQRCVRWNDHPELAVCRL
jgi:hypothetical protein